VAQAKKGEQAASLWPSSLAEEAGFSIAQPSCIQQGKQVPKAVSSSNMKTKHTFTVQIYKTDKNSAFSMGMEVLPMPRSRRI